MKASDVISRVRNITGDVNSLQFSDEQLLDWINEGVRECAVMNNLLQKSGTSASVIGTSDYALPTDILKLHSVKYDGVKLDILTLEQFDARYGTADDITGTPMVCYIWAGKVNFFPAPAAVGSIRIDYIYDPVIITDPNTELSIPVSYHQRIIDYTLAQVAQQDDNSNLYTLKMQQFETGVRGLKDDEFTIDLYPGISVSPRDMGGAGDGYWDLGYSW